MNIDSLSSTSQRISNELRLVSSLSAPLNISLVALSIITLLGGLGFLSGTNLGYAFALLGGGSLAVSIIGAATVPSHDTRGILGCASLYNVALITLGTLAALGILSPTIPAWVVIAPILFAIGPGCCIGSSVGSSIGAGAGMAGNS